MLNRIHLIVWCLAAAILSFVILEYWNSNNAKSFQKFERLWQEDVALLEQSGKLPAGWFDVAEIVVIGGTPESKDWLKRIKTPLKLKSGGNFKLEVLVVVWEENRKKGILIQYDLVNKESGNNDWELARTLIIPPKQRANLTLDAVIKLLGSSNL